MFTTPGCPFLALCCRGLFFGLFWGPLGPILLLRMVPFIFFQGATFRVSSWPGLDCVASSFQSGCPLLSPPVFCACPPTCRCPPRTGFLSTGTFSFKTKLQWPRMICNLCTAVLQGNTLSHCLIGLYARKFMRATHTAAYNQEIYREGQKGVCLLKVRVEFRHSATVIKVNKGCFCYGKVFRAGTAQILEVGNSKPGTHNSEAKKPKLLNSGIPKPLC